MTTLYISAYPETSKLRQNELDTCLEKNRMVFDRVIVLAEHPKQGYENVIVLPVSCRPTFRTFFNAVNHITQKDDINIVANSDIYFQELTKYPAPHQVFALTRWESNDFFLNRNDSQDTWIFNGNIRMPGYCDFYMGFGGCDNRLAMELSRVGYEVLNPSLTIKTFHLHSIPTDHKGKLVVNRPYLKLNPCTI
jgi:hypothetical protein